MGYHALSIENVYIIFILVQTKPSNQCRRKVKVTLKQESIFTNLEQTWGSIWLSLKWDDEKQGGEKKIDIQIHQA